MSGKGAAQLRQLFADSYETLRTRVARRLGTSGDLAGDALHDAYVRLVDKGGFDDIEYPQSYIVNTAMHVAIDRMRRDARLLSTSEIEGFLEVEDAAPGPARSAELRENLDGMFEMLQAMPPRQRDVLIAIRAHGLSRSELAKRWGISERQIGRELQKAHEFCAAARKEREAGQDVGA